ncbi:MAG: aspartate kinase [Clostridia bacterium]|nr:aspartate kinase [Clostridia bacterium]
MQEKTVVLKFGGSSVADNDKLKIVANKVIGYKKEYKNVVVILSAQGKTTDRLIGEAMELSKNPDKRETAMLISTGEQVSIAKLAILLDEMNVPAISLTGWQAGIKSSIANKCAIIENIDISRIEKELKEDKIVIVAGFQGVNAKNDISTLGRGGSDTTAVAVAAALEADKCYIFSDVDGVYTADPNKIKEAKKLQNISYKEMIDISNEGAKVLHDRSIKIGEKFNVPIVTKSTFTEDEGTRLSKTIEENTVKSVVKKDVTKISIIGEGIMRNTKLIEKIINIIENEEVEVLRIEILDSKISVIFKDIIQDSIVQKFHEVSI